MCPTIDFLNVGVCHFPPALAMISLYFPESCMIMSHGQSFLELMTFRFTMKLEGRGSTLCSFWLYSSRTVINSLCLFSPKCPYTYLYGRNQCDKCDITTIQIH